MAHISRNTIDKHLEPNTTDVQVLHPKSLETSEGKANCEICELSKSKAILSRRQIRAGNAPFEVIYADLIDINPVAYNGDKWAFHAVCDHTNFHFCLTS